MGSTKSNIKISSAALFAGVSAVAVLFAGLSIEEGKFPGFGADKAYAQGGGGGSSGGSGSGSGGSGNSGGGSGGSGSDGHDSGDHEDHEDGDDGDHADGGGSGSSGQTQNRAGQGSSGSGGTSGGGGGSGGNDSGGGSSDGGSGSDNGNQGGSDSGSGNQGGSAPAAAASKGGGADAGKPADTGSGGAASGRPADKGGGMQGDRGDEDLGALFGDLYVILRDANGVPLLKEIELADGTSIWVVQPIDADGNLIDLDEEGHPVDEDLVEEVELGRLNVGRAPNEVLDTRLLEVINLMNAATAITTDASGRLVLTVPEEEGSTVMIDKTIDSPLENLAIYLELMTDGTIEYAQADGTVLTVTFPNLEGGLPSEFDHLIDGDYTPEDLAAATVFLAAGTDKTGVFSTDEVVYLNAFLGINTVTADNSDVTYSVVDYSSFTYDRATTYQDWNVDVLVPVVNEDGEVIDVNIATVNIYDAVFGSTDYDTPTDATALAAWTQAADDAREVIEFLHEYEIPLPSTTD